jgi:aspartyl/asparaginyl beta-hydroxylase (cupin superfamily)
MNHKHPITQQLVPFPGCLWETMVPKTAKDEICSKEEETIHRLVSPPYVDARKYFPKEVQLLHENIDLIRAEASLIAHWTAWPEQQHYQAASENDVDDDDDGNNSGAPWNVFPLCYCFPANDVTQRHWIPLTTAVVPQTFRVLQALGNKLRTALFSRLDAGARLEAHTGWEDLANHVLRLHVPLDIPPGYLCGTWVDGCVMTHQSDPNEPWVCFDDSKTHRAFNYAAQPRTVLILDLERPSNLPIGTATGGHSDELDSFIAQMSSPR